jgi:toxin ParE1/3/4
MKQVIQAEALAELRDAFAYYEAKLPGLGQQFLDEFSAAAKRIIENPKRFPRIERRATRAKTNRFPYGLVYWIQADVITIAAVMHLSRRPGYWIKRLP